jgi:hypothetical protein
MVMDHVTGYSRDGCFKSLLVGSLPAALSLLEVLFVVLDLV